MNTVLVTGGNGFLGANTARELYRKGYNVKVMARATADMKALSGLPCEIVYGDISNKQDVYEAVVDCDFVVHAASATSQWGLHYNDYEKVNVTGTKNIVEACLYYHIKKLVYVSTANTKAPGSKVAPGNELGAFTLFRINSPYINTKYLAQQIVAESVVNKQLPAVIVHPTFMIGANDTKPSSGQMVLHALKKKVLLFPPGGKNFVHINDVSHCIINAMENGATGESYIAAGENISYKEFFKEVNTIAGQKPVMIKVPSFILKAAGWIGTLAGSITKKNFKLNYASSYMLCLQNYYSNEKSQQELKMQFTPVTTAIKDAYTWFSENKYC